MARGIALGAPSTDGARRSTRASPTVSSSRKRFDAHDAARLVAIGWLVGIGAFLLLVLLRDLDAGTIARRDQECFRLAGVHVLAGGTGYEEVARTFANPPFTLPLVAALGLLDPRGAFVALALLGIAASVLALALLTRVPELSPRARATAILVGLTCPSLLLSFHLGQPSGLYLLVASLAVFGLARERDVLAGVASGLLLAKPPLALALLALGTLARPRRFLVAWITTALALFGVGLLFGLDAWHGFLASLATLAERHDASPDSWRKQLTLYAIARELLFDAAGADASATLRTRSLARLIAFAVDAALVTWALRLALRARARLADPSLAPSERASLGYRLGAIALLMTIALNLYLFFYDGALAVVPTLFLLTHAASYRSRARLRLAVLCAVGVWLAALLPLLTTSGPNPTGAIALVWLVVELLELRARTRERGEREPSPPSPPRGPTERAEPTELTERVEPTERGADQERKPPKYAAAAAPAATTRSTAT